jgi:hypothetical protein
MSPYTRTSASLIEILLVVIAAGLIARNRWRLSPFFVAYLVVGLVVDILITNWPEHFYVRSFWISVELTTAFLKLGLVLEVAWQTFRAFPGAQSVALRIVLIILATTSVAVLAVPLARAGSTPADIALSQFEPRFVNGIVWLAAATLAVARWYRVPVHPFHSVILTGLAIYTGLCSALYTAAPHLDALFGPDAFQVWGGIVEASTFQALAAWWAYTAWRPDSRRIIAHAETLRSLKLRASSCG